MSSKSPHTTGTFYSITHASTFHRTMGRFYTCECLISFQKATF